MNTQPSVRIRAVKIYIRSQKSLRETSAKLGIPHITLWRWVNWYKEGGEENLKRKKPYKRPWNRPSKEVEQKVALLKEANPSLTLKKAQGKLANDGVRLSLNGIWKIWKRYALTARPKKDPYTSFGTPSPETEDSFKKIKALLKKEMFRKASVIANHLPSFPQDAVLREIPEKMLSPRRQLDRLFFFFGKMPFPEFYKKAKKIRTALEKKMLLYSSILAGLVECLALGWMETPIRELELIAVLKQRAKDVRDPSIRFLLSKHEGKIYAHYFFNEGKAKKCLRVCRRLLRLLPYSFYFADMASLLSVNMDYKNASFYFQKAIKVERNKDSRKTLYRRLAITQAIAGNYKESIKSLHTAGKSKESYLSLSAITEAFCAFALGNISKALSLFKSVLEKSKSGELHNQLHAATLGLATIQAALNDKKKAETFLRKYIPLFRKYKMEHETLIRDILLGKRIIGNTRLNEFPTIRLITIIQEGDKQSSYEKAFKFARNKGLLGFFHRIIVFFPESVLAMLKKGKDTGLPRAILNLPVFRKEIPVYSVRFLGKLTVYKNQKYLKVKLRPKDAAFLIYLASSKRKSKTLDKIYNNFWLNSKNPPRNLAHLLVRIRKALKLPSHFLYVKERKLVVECYFTTDYGEYQEHLAQAKALLRAGEWGFAKREFMQAFKLFRGKPFKKMYDDWSDDKRLEVLFSYEKEVKVFADELFKRGRTEEARRVLERAERIVGSE